MKIILIAIAVALIIIGGLIKFDVIPQETVNEVQNFLVKSPVITKTAESK